MEAEELQSTAQMARLTLSPAEEQRLRVAVERMLAYCSHMASLPVDDLEPTTHALLARNRLRADEEAGEVAARDATAGWPAPGGPSAGAAAADAATDAPLANAGSEALLANAPEREDRFILIPNLL